MSKIVKAINSMIVNRDKISDIHESPYSEDNSELFFEYANKYVWSILEKDNGEYLLYFYPNAKSSKVMSDVPYECIHEHAIITYGAEELASKEAKASIRELFNMLRQKLYNVDSVLDDIISDDIPF